MPCSPSRTSRLPRPHTPGNFHRYECLDCQHSPNCSPHSHSLVDRKDCYGGWSGATAVSASFYKASASILEGLD